MPESAKIRGMFCKLSYPYYQSETDMLDTSLRFTILG